MTYVTATRSRSVYMTHVCSKCGFPIVSVIQIEVAVTEESNFANENADLITNENAEKIIEREINRIESCRINKTMLFGTECKNVKISKNLCYNSSIKGFSTACPYCEHIECWQKVFNKIDETNEESLNMNDENYPSTFTSSMNVEKWATNHVLKKIEMIDNLRKDPQIIEQAKMVAVDSNFIIRKLEKQLESMPEKNELKNTLDELQIIRQHKKQFGIFDRTRKKEADLKIKSLEANSAKLNDIIDQKISPIKEKLKEEKLKLYYNQAVAFGCSEEIVTESMLNACCYLYVPNDFPDDLIEDFLKNEFDDNQLPKEENIFCRKCGFKLISDSVFCSRCGSKL